MSGLDYHTFVLYQFLKASKMEPFFMHNSNTGMFVDIEKDFEFFKSRSSFMWLLILRLQLVLKVLN